MNIRHGAEYVSARAALAIVPLLPRRWVVALAHAAGHVAYGLAAHLRKTGRANLDMAFGDSKTKAEKKAILIESFQTFALVLLDLFWFSRNPAERIPKHVHLDEQYRTYLANTGAAICLTAHAGNWELQGKSISLLGYPLTSVAAPLENHALDELFNRLRTETGQIIIPKIGAARALIKTLKNGGKVAFLLDQNTKPSDGGIFLDFFGHPAPVSSIGASLLSHTGARIFFGVCLPDRRGDYHMDDPVEIDVSDLADANRHRLIRDITARILQTIEQFIRRNPGPWLWSYKRWKYVAPGHPREEYPFYSKVLLPHDREAAEKWEEMLGAS